MPLDRNPKAAKPWVPDLLFEPVAPPAAPVAKATGPTPDAKPAELVAATVAAVQEAAPQPVERPALPTPPLSESPRVSDSPSIAAPRISDSNDPGELRDMLAGHEKALLKTRILRRNLQEDISKARRTFMFAERTRLHSAKSALDALIAQEQQGEAEERRLASEILEIRSRLERLTR